MISKNKKLKVVIPVRGTKTEEKKIETIFSDKITYNSLAYVDRMIRNRTLSATNARAITTKFVEKIDSMDKKWLMPFSVLIFNLITNYNHAVELPDLVKMSNTLYRIQNAEAWHLTIIPRIRSTLRGFIRKAAKRLAKRNLPSSYTLDEDAQTGNMQKT